MQKEKKINVRLMTMMILPIVLFGIVMTVFEYVQVQREIEKEVEQELREVIAVVGYDFNQMYPGDYELKETGTEKSLYKGEVRLSKNYQYIDNFKERTGLDISIFYDDMRYLTTITGNTSLRSIGTKTRTFIYDSVVKNGETVFYEKVSVGNETYATVYGPVSNLDGENVGMIGIAKPLSEVNKSVRRMIIPILFITLLMGIAAILLCIIYTNENERMVGYIKAFLRKVSTGDLNAEMEGGVLVRKDQFGEVAKAATTMQYKLRKLVEYDMLTDIFNRASGEKRLKDVIEDSEVNRLHYSVAIGDIDFFKSVNDTYGHEMGDQVLSGVAAILKAGMTKSGYAVRWGGEEFLLIFRETTKEEAAVIIRGILDSIRAAEFSCEDMTVKVTMTVGLVQGREGEDNNQVVKRADDLLYEGKEGGRNRLVTE